MSRWVLTLVGVGFAVASVQAQPKPLWEIDTFPNDKKVHDVQWVDFSPDGKTLAAQVIENFGIGGVMNSRLLAWDATTRKEVRLDDGAWAAAKYARKSSDRAWFNTDNSYSLTMGDSGDGDVTLVYGKVPPRAADPKKVVREQLLSAPLSGKWAEARPVVTVNSDLTRLAFGSRKDHKLSLYNLTVDAKLRLTEVAVVPSGHVGHLSALGFSPNGKTLATGSEESSVFLWDIEKAGKDWAPRATVATGNFTVSALAFSPDGRTLAAGTFEWKGRPNLYVIDVAGGKLLGSYALTGALTSLAFSPDSKVLVTGDNLGRLQAWGAEALRNP